MNSSQQEDIKNEASFMRLYRELTGASEAEARSVFMYEGCGESELDGAAVPEEKKGESTLEPGMGRQKRVRGSAEAKK